MFLPAYRKEQAKVQTLKALARRRRDDEEGFTLIELMVVVLIIAILIAIAIPTFLGARQRANDRAAQSSLRNALTAAKTSFTDTGDYGGAIAGVVGPPATGLKAIEPSLTFVVGASTDFKTVSVAVPAANAQSWWAEVLSKSGKCFGILDNSGAGGGTTYAGTTTALAAACTAPATAPTWADASW
jgi:type IV pilus assembly protein PilA